MVSDVSVQVVEKLCGLEGPRPLQPELPAQEVATGSINVINPPLHALVIGVNNYQNHTRLQAAVRDAEAFRTFLVQTLSVPDHQITFLHDEQANRAGIIAGFHKLIHDNSIQRGDPIVIYYAGHGGEIQSPPERIHHGPKIQCIIPQDAGTKSTPGASPIPDFTIGALLDKLARAKGNNITVIFDCCHSASGSRDETDQSRFVKSDDLCLLPAQADSDLAPPIPAESRDLIIPQGFAGQAMSSHILIAACAHGESAYENKDTGQGYFTAALLDILGKGVERLTYKGFMQRFPKLEPRGGSQNPVCEGKHINRILFNAKVIGADSSFIAIKKEKGNHYLQAGLAQGITPGSTFAIHSDLIIGPNNPALGTLVVKESKPFLAVLQLPEHAPPFIIPSEAYGRQIGCGPGRELEIAFTADFMNAARQDSLWESAFSGKKNHLTLRPTDEEFAQVIVGRNQEGRATFRIRNPAAIKYGVDILPYMVHIEAKPVLHVLQAAAHWNWHVNRTPGSHPFQRSVNLEFYKLAEKGWNDAGERIMAPRGDNLNRAGEAEIVVRSGESYGLKIVNNSQRDLYAYPFYFSVKSQAIYPLFTKVVGGGRVDPSLPSSRTAPGGNFVAVGFGAGGVIPFRYLLRDDKDIELGIYKVFLTTSPADFDSIRLDNPFDHIGGDARALMWDEEVDEVMDGQDLWDSVEMTLIQRRYPNPDGNAEPLLTAESLSPAKIRAFGRANSFSWFRAAALSEEILSKASYMRLATKSTEHGPTGNVSPERSHTWFSICIISEDGLPRVGPGEEILQWRSHTNKHLGPSDMETPWIHGQIFDRNHEIWSCVKAGDSFEVLAIARDKGWVNIADMGLLEVY